MSDLELKKIVEELWDNKDSVDLTNEKNSEKIKKVLDLLDRGQIRVCEKNENKWITNQWIKKAILLSFRINDNSIFSSGMSNLRRGQYTWFDKVNLKTSGWVEDEWTKINFRSVPITRYDFRLDSVCYIAYPNGYRMDRPPMFQDIVEHLS